MLTSRMSACRGETGSTLFRHLDGQEGRTAVTLHQEGHGFPGGQRFDQLVELAYVADVLVIDPEDDIAEAKVLKTVLGGKVVFEAGAE